MIPILHDMRAACYLLIALAMLLVICALAGLGAVLQPVRWSDRKAHHRAKRESIDPLYS